MNNEIIIYFMRSGICLTIFFSFYWLFLRKEKTFRFNRYYLLSSVALSYIFPLINFSGLFNKETIAALPGTIVQNFITPVNITPVIMENENVVLQQPRFNLLDYMIYIYIAVAAILIIQMLIGMVKLYLIWKRGSKQKTGDYIIVYTKDNIAPFSFFRFVFLNKDKIVENSLNQIIAHEREHIAQHHSFDTLFINIAAAMQWFNPFVWLTKKALQETHEFLADEKVIAQGFDSAIYSELLINQIAGVKAMDFANYFNHLLIKKRLVMLQKLKPGKLASLKKILILPMAVLLAVSFNIQGQDKNLKIVEKSASKPHKTEAHNIAFRDSIMDLKSPAFRDKITQTISILQQDIILPKDIDGKKYFYSVGAHFDADKKRIDIEANRHPLDKNGNPIRGSKMEYVDIINYDELISKIPKVAWEDYLEGKVDMGFSGSTLIIEKLQKHFEYWKTHN